MTIVASAMSARLPAHAAIDTRAPDPLCFAEDGDPGVASPENLTNQGAGGGGGCTGGPPGATIGLADGGPGRVTVTFRFV